MAVEREEEEEEEEEKQNKTSYCSQIHMLAGWLAC